MSEELSFTNRRATEMAVRAAKSRNSPMKGGQEKTRMVDPTTCEIEYTPDEIEFMNAVQAYKQRTGRMFPTNREILEILHELGYHKVGMIV